jgi:hypothetical protein
MNVIAILDALTYAVAGASLLVVVAAWRTHSARARLMAGSWALGGAALAFSVLIGHGLSVRADSADFARGLSLGLAVGLFLGSARLDWPRAPEPKRRRA